MLKETSNCSQFALSSFMLLCDEWLMLLSPQIMTHFTIKQAGDFLFTTLTYRFRLWFGLFLLFDIVRLKILLLELAYETKQTFY